MPYYRTIDHKTVPSNDGYWYRDLPVDLYFEKWGWRNSPPRRGTTTLVPGKVAEPFSWLDANNSIKAGVFRSEHPNIAHLFKKDVGHSWDLATAKFSPELFSYRTQNQYGQITTGTNLRLIGQQGIPNYKDPLSFEGTDIQLSNYAALEYGSTAPTSDQFSVSAFVGELREGLPRLIPALLSTGDKRAFKKTLERQTRRAKDAGSDYLNVQFGWIPLLSDVRKIATALAVATTATSSSELTTHRRREKPGSDVTYAGSSNLVSGFVSHNMSAFGSEVPGVAANVEIACTAWGSQRSTMEYSFEAEFLRLPRNSYDDTVYLSKFEELMRVDITPEDLWQLAPWSWLVDWFFDIGGQLESWQSATTNSILSLYAYGMRTERRLTTTVLSDMRKLTGWHAFYEGPSTYFGTIEAVRKQRIKANPFGYNLEPLTQLSAGQLAILGALGLTKTKR